MGKEVRGHSQPLEYLGYCPYGIGDFGTRGVQDHSAGTRRKGKTKVLSQNCSQAINLSPSVVAAKTSLEQVPWCGDMTSLSFPMFLEFEGTFVTPPGLRGFVDGHYCGTVALEEENNTFQVLEQRAVCVSHRTGLPCLPEEFGGAKRLEGLF
uniref:Uncharacterized protein n=1 Tax=Molossus molossus TaxID=27622 RepID=A0A7J8FSC5_MOLMO|nr:hypothetical protein HJG59_008417 [Molossus molossus]